MRNLPKSSRDRETDHRPDAGEVIDVLMSILGAERTHRRTRRAGSALARADEREQDVVLLAVDVDGVTGDAVARELRARARPGRKQLVVAPRDVEAEPIDAAKRRPRRA